MEVVLLITLVMIIFSIILAFASTVTEDLISCLWLGMLIIFIFVHIIIFCYSLDSWVNSAQDSDDIHYGISITDTEREILFIEDCIRVSFEEKVITYYLDGEKYSLVVPENALVSVVPKADSIADYVDAGGG